MRVLIRWRGRRALAAVLLVTENGYMWLVTNPSTGETHYLGEAFVSDDLAWAAV